MKSMTGYGRGEASNGDVSIVVEMKSVNNRFRDVNIRVPREYLVLEPRIQNMLKSAVHRGRVDVFVRRNAAESSQSVRADPLLAERYHKAMSDVAKRVQRAPSEIPLAALLNQPGVLTIAEPEADALVEWNVVSAAVEAALAELCQMRNIEGAALQADLRGHLDGLQRLWAEVQAATEGLNDRIRERIELRIQKLLGERMDPGRMAQEAALLADKADVSEEIARILSHCKQFSEGLKSTDPVGRKLEFLVQELNREVNTIGSKAAEHPVSHLVVEMKSTLERLREQAANVE